MDNNFLILAIDGGAASGKSSTSRLLADQYHLLHVDTGAHYRALTFCLLQANIQHTDNAAIQAFLKTVGLHTEVSGNRALIRVNGYLPHEKELKSQSVNSHVSYYSALASLRQALLSYQRNEVCVAKEHAFKGIIMEGRDIGSVVLPEAHFKFYLEAQPEARVLRRQEEADTILQRDSIDSTRSTSPLTCPPDAIRIDSTHKTLEQVSFLIASLAQLK